MDREIYITKIYKIKAEKKTDMKEQILQGEKDKTGKVAQYNKAWAKRTGYPLKIINDAAHNANVDQLNEVNTCIRVFLSETIQ